MLDSMLMVLLQELTILVENILRILVHYPQKLQIMAG